MSDANGANGHDLQRSTDFEPLTRDRFVGGVDRSSEREQLDRLEQMVHNITMISRQVLQRGLGGDPRRDYKEECGLPQFGPISAWTYQNQWDRNPVAARVVELMPKECFKVTPYVYETDDPNEVTPFERAWDDLGKSLRASGRRSWFQDEEGSPVWEYLQRLDTLAGIGSYGVLLFGLDDGLDPRLPPEGWDEEGSEPAGDRPEGTQHTPQGQTAGEGSQRSELAGPKPTGQIKPKAKASTLRFNTTTGRLARRHPAYRITVNEEAQKGRKLLYLRVFPETLAQITTWESNPRSPRFGQPNSYLLTYNDPRQAASGTGVPLASIQVHWTRVLHYCDGHHQATSSEVFAVPRMQPVFDNVLGLEKLYAADPEMYWKAGWPGLQFSTHAQLGGQVKVDVAAMRDAVEQYANGLERFLLGRGGQWSTLAPNIADATSKVAIQLEAVCIKLGCPVPVFKGYEIGEQASDNNTDDWTTKVLGRRNGLLTPRLFVPFIDRLIDFGVLPKPTKGNKKPTLPAPGQEQLPGMADPEAVPGEQDDPLDEGQDEGAPPESASGVPSPFRRAKRRPQLEMEANAFCPTGEGGGVDPGCSPGGGGGAGTEGGEGHSVKVTVDTGMDYAALITVGGESKVVGGERFTIGGDRFNFHASRFGEGPWHVTFSNEGGRHQITGDMGHRAVAVMRTVGKALDNFVASKKPDAFEFSAAGDEPSRVSLYGKAARAIAIRHGYDVTSEGNRWKTDWKFKKRAGRTDNRLRWSFDEILDSLLTANAPPPWLRKGGQKGGARPGGPPGASAKAPADLFHDPAEGGPDTGGEGELGPDGEPLSFRDAAQGGPESKVFQSEAGYSIEWPESSSDSPQVKAQVNLTNTQAIAAYIAGSVENIVPPMAYLTSERFLGMDEEEAAQWIEEGKLNEARTEMEQQALAEEHGFQPEAPEGMVDPEERDMQHEVELARAKNPGGPKGGPPFGGGGGGPGGGFPPSSGRGGRPRPKGPKPPSPFSRNATTNAFCPTGKGGGIDPSCSPGEGGSYGGGGGGPATVRPGGGAIKAALHALARGESVKLAKPEHLVKLVARIEHMRERAREMHRKMPKFDLCKVTVKGSNLFCGETLGVPRAKMPQLRGFPKPGSKADELPKSGAGKVDLGKGFVKELRRQGIDVERTEVRASELKASQGEIVGARVAELVAASNAGEKDLHERPIFVTKDGYVVDGHHHWAAILVDGLSRGEDPKVDVRRLDMSIEDAIKSANRYAKRMGLAPKAGVGNSFCPTGEGGGIDPTCSPGGAAAPAAGGGAGEADKARAGRAEDRRGAAGRVARVIEEAKKVRFSEEKLRPGVEEGDYRAIEYEMTSAEEDQMEDSIAQTRDDELSDYLDSSFESHVTDEDAANHADLDVDAVGSEVHDRVIAAGGDQRMAGIIGGAIGSPGTAGVAEAIGAAREQRAGAAVVAALENYADEMVESIAQAREELVDREMEAHRESVEESWDDTDARREYLDGFYRRNPDRFGGSGEDVQPDTWYRDGSEHTLHFDAAGQRFKATIDERNRGFGEHNVHDFQFSDEQGNFRVTGEGGPRGALEVFAKVVPAAVAYIKERDPPVMTFSAAEPSRQKLYDRLVRTIASAVPEYFAVAVKPPEGSSGSKQYVVAKRSVREAVMERAKRQGMDDQTEILVNALADPTTELTPTVNEAWWTEEGWREDGNGHGAARNSFCPTGEGGGVDPTCSPVGGGSGSFGTMADSAVRDSEVAGSATIMGGTLLPPSDYPRGYYRTFPVVYRGSREGPAPGHFIYVTPDRELASIHAGPGGKVEEFRLLPGAKVYPDPEVFEEMVVEHGGVSGYASLFGARTAVVYADHLGPKVQPRSDNSFCPTGQGGGVDPTCSPGGGAAAPGKAGEEARPSVTDSDRSHSDRSSFKEAVRSGEVKEGINVVEPFVYEVKDGKAEIKKDLDAVYDVKTNSYKIVWREMPPEAIEDRVYDHGTSAKVGSVEELRPGKGYGNWGRNEFDGIYLTQRGANAETVGGKSRNPWGDTNVAGKLKPGTKLARSNAEVHEAASKHPDLGTQAALEAEGYHGVARIDVRGDVWELVLFSNRLVKVDNSFCPTGQGGGVDPSCSPGGQAAAPGKDKGGKGDFLGDVSVGSGSEWQREFRAGGARYTFGAKSYGMGSWGVHFADPKGGFKATHDKGAGAVGVMRAAGRELDRFIKEKDPDSFFFTADSSERSRVELYDKVSRLIAARHGYEVDRGKRGDYVLYQFDRKDADEEATARVINAWVGTTFVQMWDAEDRVTENVLAAEMAVRSHVETRGELTGNARADAGLRRSSRVYRKAAQDLVANLNAGEMEALAVRLCDLVGNSFCPTGEGGGIDPTCSPDGGSGGGREPHPKTTEEALGRFNARSKVLAGKDGGKAGAFDVDVGEGRLISVRLNPQLAVRAGKFQLEHRVRLDFGVFGREDTSVAEKMDAASLRMLRKVKEMAKAYHNAGFKLEVEASDERRRELYVKTLRKLGAKLEGGDKSVQIWNEDCGAGSEGGQGFQQGNTCAKGDGGGAEARSGSEPSYRRDPGHSYYHGPEAPGQGWRRVATDPVHGDVWSKPNRAEHGPFARAVGQVMSLIGMGPKADPHVPGDPIDVKKLSEMPHPVRQLVAQQARSPAYREMSKEVDRYQGGQWDHFAKQAGKSPEAFREDVRANAQRLVDQNEVYARVPADLFPALLESGRYKNQAETGQAGGGATAIETRRRQEERGMGVPRGEDPATRPMYAYLSEPGWKGLGADSSRTERAFMDRYGKYVLRLKPHVKERSTVTFGDSLDGFTHHEVQASPAGRVDVRSVHPGWIHKGGPGVLQSLGEFGARTKAYVEATVHGGLSLSDVAEVGVPRNAPPEVRAGLDRRGIKWFEIREERR